MSPSKRVSAAIAALLVATRAFAAHPLQTEDTGTQGAGNLELENGLAWSRFDGGRLFSYQPQFSFGAAPTFDLIVQPSWLAARDRVAEAFATGAAPRCAAGATRMSI